MGRLLSEEKAIQQWLAGSRRNENGDARGQAFKRRARTTKHKNARTSYIVAVIRML